VVPDDNEKGAQQVPKVASVVDWLRGLGLNKYEDVFVREEVDWDTLQWLTEEVNLISFIPSVLGSLMLSRIVCLIFSFKLC